LEAILSQIKPHGVVVACGLAGGHELSTTVYPFILRGVRLIGIDSNTCPQGPRRQAWKALTELLSTVDLERIARDVTLNEVPEACEQLMRGGIRGRFVVDLRTAG
jgi:acrylyl-CoA reductase (NADPH)